MVEEHFRNHMESQGKSYMKWIILDEFTIVSGFPVEKKTLEKTDRSENLTQRTRPQQLRHLISSTSGGHRVPSIRPACSHRAPMAAKGVPVVVMLIKLWFLSSWKTWTRALRKAETSNSLRPFCPARNMSVRSRDVALGVVSVDRSEVSKMDRGTAGSTMFNDMPTPCQPILHIKGAVSANSIANGVNPQ